MTKTVAIASEIRELQAEMAKAEKLIASYPQYPSLLVDHGSLRKRQEKLQKLFAQEAGVDFVDVCNRGSAVPTN